MQTANDNSRPAPVRYCIPILVFMNVFAPALIFIAAVGLVGACSCIFLVGKVNQNNIPLTPIAQTEIIENG